MSKKRWLGFTLIELLAVIFIIALISLISIPTINKVAKQSREKLYQSQISSIIVSAKNWSSKNAKFLPDKDGELITITLGQLKVDGFIDDSIKNPKTKKLFSDDMEIIIKKVLQNYEYKVIENSGSSESTVNWDSPFIIMNGLVHETVEIHTEYLDKGVIARAQDGTIINDVNVTIKLNNTIVSNIETNKLSQYKITYSVSYNGVNASAIRTVTIKDTIPPVLLISGNIELSTEEVLTFDFEEGVNATDNSLKIPTITWSGTLSTLPGTYYINYTATDESGNKITKVRSITVKDPSAPVISEW
ncbi:MAG: prepilin-type N-terminal cleavage/methylation domain-containing protein [Bacilli bacterium]|nr:prepilin-type N-terminal cleavage/methylation domain-containing protein [Bacilli bacterium]